MPKTTDKNKYFVVKERAVPEVLLNVVAAKKLLESKRAATVQEAADAVGISRSSFYKYKDDIFPFHEEAKGKTITFIIQMDDEPGILSNVLRAIAENHGNILTIHQSIPISGIATLTLSVQILQGEGDAEAMVDEELYGTYSLAEDQVIQIGDTNVCEIKDGEVKMTEADCPDHLCMKQPAVGSAGGYIVCLPNRVVIQGEGDSDSQDSESGFDAVV